MKHILSYTTVSWLTVQTELDMIPARTPILTLIIEINTVHGPFASNTNTHMLEWQGACSLVDWMDALEHRWLATMDLEKSPTWHHS